MTEEPKRTIAFLCPACRQSVVVERTVFQLAAGTCRLPCPCGGSAVTIEMEADHADVTVPCLYCGEDHHARVPAHALLHQKVLALSCKGTDLDCCYIGEEDAVFGALKRLEEAALQVKEKPEERGDQLNEMVMTEVLSELRDIAARGGVSCSCGSKDYKVKIHYSSVELECANCGSVLRLPAATGEDLADLCCQYTLLIGGKEG